MKHIIIILMGRIKLLLANPVGYAFFKLKSWDFCSGELKHKQGSKESYIIMLPRYDRMKWKPKFLTLLLLIFLCVHQTSPHVPDVDESKVESWVVERRSDMSDLFTVSMKSGSRCYHEWSGKFSANYLSLVGNYESCTYYCDPKFPTFLPSLQTCINATLAASIGGECNKKEKIYM